MLISRLDGLKHNWQVGIQSKVCSSNAHFQIRWIETDQEISRLSERPELQMLISRLDGLKRITFSAYLCIRKSSNAHFQIRWIETTKICHLT